MPLRLKNSAAVCVMRARHAVPLPSFRQTTMTCQSQQKMKVLRWSLVPRMRPAPRDSSVLAWYCFMADRRRSSKAT